MAKLTLNDITGGFSSATQLNKNFDDIETELQDKVLYRDNPVGEPNEMNNDLDMNSNDLLNVETTFTSKLVLDGVAISTESSIVPQSYIDYEFNADLGNLTITQVTFTILGGYTPGLVDVHLNGDKLDVADFTATDGNDIILGSGIANALDRLEVRAWGTFVSADHLAKSQNLADLPSVVTARANLDIYSTSEVDNIITPNTVFITSEADIIDLLSGGEIVLEADTIYHVKGDYTAVNPMRFSSGSLFIGDGARGPARVTYTGTGAFLRADSVDLVCRGMSITALSASLIDFDGNSGVNQVLLNELQVLVLRMGTVNNALLFATDKSEFIHSGGFIFSGSSNNTIVVSSTLFATTTPQVHMDLYTSVWLNISFLQPNVIGTGSVFMAGLPNSANITGSATVSQGVMSSGVIPLLGITTGDIRWKFRDNRGIANSKTIAFGYINSPATTTIVSAGVPVIVAGTWVQQASTQRASVAANGEITMLNLEEEGGMVTVGVVATKVSGGSSDYTFTIQKDSGSGYADVEGSFKTIELTTTSKSVTFFGLANFSSGDMFRIVVEAVTGTTDVDVLVSQFLIGS